MRMRCVMHAPFEGPAAIEDWVRAKGWQMVITRTYAGEKLPSVDEFDILVLMGGPQSPFEIDQYPYLQDEIVLVSQATAASKAMIGFCLGSQIIAEALGAATLRSPEREVGVFPVKLTKEGREDPVFGIFPEAFPVFHWHNDIPGIPEGAVLLANSPGCPRQAFRYGDRVYGLQFHLEPTRESAGELIDNCPADLAPGKYVQTAEQILSADFAAINKKMIAILDALAGQIQAGQIPNQ